MPHRGKLLAVAREAAHRAMYGDLLERDHHLRIVDREEACLDVAAEYRPDVILLDVPLTDEYGLGTCRRLRLEGALGGTRIVVLSPKTGERAWIRARDAGADDYLVRPFEDEELVARIESHLRIRRAENFDRLVSGLLTLVGQETRKALGSFMGIAELLESSSPFTEEELGSYGTLLEESAEDLRDLLDRARTLHSLKTGTLRFHKQPLPLCALVKSAIHEVAPLADRRKITLQERHTADPVVTADRKMMSRVILFLLKNAVHFSHGNGVITASVSVSGETVRFSVADRGAGIEPGLLPHIFDEFHEHADGRGGGLYGISLAIARHIVQEHSGSIQVESRPGEGSTFTVLLPGNSGGGANRNSRSAWHPQETPGLQRRRTRDPIRNGRTSNGGSDRRAVRGEDWPGKCRPKGAGCEEPG